MKKKLRILAWKQKKGEDTQKEMDSLVQRIKEMTSELEAEGKIVKKEINHG